MKALFLMMSFVLITACGKEYEYENVEREESDYNRVINTKSMPKKPNLNKDIYLVNEEYPMEVALYEDGKFYYNFATLGDGTGTWKFGKDLVIDTDGERELFNVTLHIFTTDEEGENYKVRFIDRFGYRVIDLKKKNLSNK